ncbi:MAG: LAGLIDADG family homing endonuclease, partial [Halobacteria archaeon]|nr:LAGLIDADG family homing endonuclease [Halobacteria archaeon]
MNGGLWQAGDALEYARQNGEVVHEDEGMCLYDAGTTTQTLNPEGEIIDTDCMVYEKEYDGNVYTFETKTGRRIRVSGNHPFLVNRAGAIQWVKARNLDEDDYLVTPRQLDLPEKGFRGHEETLRKLDGMGEYEVVTSHTVEKIVAKIDDDNGNDNGNGNGNEFGLTRHELDVLRIAAGMTKKELADEVDANYDQVLNYFGGAENGVGEQIHDVLVRKAQDGRIEVADYVESHKTHRMEDAMEDAEAGFFVGFILAEGTVEDGYVEITQKNLSEKFDRWVEIAERVGVDVSIRERETGREARIHSKPFVDYLDERYSIREPTELLSAPEEFRNEFLEIFLLTESHYDADNKRITFTQKDEETTNLVAYLLLDHGIVPWVYDEGRVYRLKIQGEDIEKYLENFEWRGEPPVAEGFNSSHRCTPLDDELVENVVENLGFNYDGMTDTDTDINAVVEDDLQKGAQMCGLSMTDIVEETDLSKHTVWKSYESDDRPAQAVEYVTQEYDRRLEEAEKLTSYLTELVESDVFYDPIKSIEKEEYDGKVIGLSVPESHNYVAGLGACGINHNTYPLPEAQQDRFMMKIVLDYPSFEEEVEIVERYTKGSGDIRVNQVLTGDELRRIQEHVRDVPISDDLRDKAIEIVTRTRENENIEFGASPRATLNIVLASKARAFLHGRNHVSESDIREVAVPVLR